MVVSWNSKSDIAVCLNSLHSQSYSFQQIIVVDNASTDGTPEVIEQNFTDVKLIKQSENQGFARGNNIGIAETQSDWVLTLNPDARLEPDWTSTLLAFVGKNEKIGAIGGKLLGDKHSTGGERVIDSTGIEIFKSRRIRDRGFGRLDTGQYELSDRVFGVCAGAALYRRSMLDDVMVEGEVFPEYFFCYYEDEDVAWRAWRRGWEAWYCPQAIGYHKRGVSPVAGKFSRYLTHRNRLWLIRRNESSMKTFSALFSIIPHEVLMLLRIIRYPYLLKAVIESLKSMRKAEKQRCLLNNKNLQPPPFQRGIGFN